MKKFLTGVVAYVCSVGVGVYTSSGNGSSATVICTTVAVLATVMARRDWTVLSGSRPEWSEVPSRDRLPRLTDYDIETVDDRVPFYMADADLFSRGS